MTKKVGKISWDEADTGRANDFMSMKDVKDYDVRIFTSPFQFYSHWTKDNTGKDRKVSCAIENCPICERGEKASAHWYIGVINRTNGNKTEILDAGSQIFQQIIALQKNPKWGDPKTYDITINRGPKGRSPLYTVTPNPKTELTAEEKAACKEFVNRVDLTKLSASPSVEKVREILGLVSAPVASSSASSFIADEDNAAADEFSDF